MVGRFFFGLSPLSLPLARSSESGHPQRPCSLATWHNESFRLAFRLQTSDVTRRVEDKYTMLLYGVQIAQYVVLFDKNRGKVSNRAPFLSTLAPWHMAPMVYSAIEDGHSI